MRQHSAGSTPPAVRLESCEDRPIAGIPAWYI
jgi:hypothetical protein